MRISDGQFISNSEDQMIKTKDLTEYERYLESIIIAQKLRIQKYETVVELCKKIAGDKNE